MVVISSFACRARVSEFEHMSRHYDFRDPMSFLDMTEIISNRRKIPVQPKITLC